MKTNTIKKTITPVTQLGMGCAMIGDLFSVTSEQQAVATIHAAYETGVRFFDTAPWYGLGKSELRLGTGLRHLPQKNREDIILATKVGRVLGRDADMQWTDTWKGGLPFGLEFDYSYDGVMRSFEDSLQRLGATQIDALAIHDLDILYHKTEELCTKHMHDLDAGGGYKALEELKTTAGVKAIGAGISLAGLIPEFVKRFDLDYFLVAIPYTLLDQSGRADMDLCHEKDISIVIGAPYASGLLVTGSKTPSTYNYAASPQDKINLTKKIENVCHAHQVQLPAAALQFVCRHPAVVSVIPGANTAEQAQQNAMYIDAPIPDAFWAELADQGIISA